MVTRGHEVRRKTGETAVVIDCLVRSQGGRSLSEKLGSAAVEQQKDSAHTAVTRQTPLVTVIVTS